MNLKLKCIKEFYYKNALEYCNDNGTGRIEKGTEIDFLLERDGLRFKINNQYTFPCDVDVIEKYFKQIES